MRSAELRVGGTYLAKVSGRVVPVLVLGETWLGGNSRTGARPRLGWRCRNTLSGREITVRSPQRFRAPAPEPTP